MIMRLIFLVIDLNHSTRVIIEFFLKIAITKVALKIEVPGNSAALLWMLLNAAAHIRRRVQMNAK